MTRLLLALQLVVDLLLLGVQEVVVEGALLHDASSGLHRYPAPYLCFENIRVEPLSCYVGLHRLQGVLHREASLPALAVLLRMIKTFLVSIRP